MVDGERLRENLAELTTSSKMPNSNQFARSASAVTPSEKGSINTNTKSTTTTRFPMGLGWIAYVAPSPQRGSQNAKWLFFVQNVNNNLRLAYFETVRDTMSVLITNRLSIGTDICHLERRNSPYFALFYRIR